METEYLRSTEGITAEVPNHRATWYGAGPHKQEDFFFLMKKNYLENILDSRNDVVLTFIDITLLDAILQDLHCYINSVCFV